MLLVMIVVVGNVTRHAGSEFTALKGGSPVSGSEAQKYSTNISDYSKAVSCPVCGFVWVHPEKVVVNAGGVVTIIED